MKPVLSFNTLLLNQVSMATSQASSALDISEVSGYSMQAVFTGSPNGSLVVLGSNDVDLGFSTVDTHTINAAGSYLLNVQSAQYTHVKVSYTATSGSGSLTVRLAGKLP